ncbi:MAG TPA: endonuclease/exonuclease/phosphatase family protein, partial [Polyangiaceae bacterium]|nr:endonuclease/exonuclease/phosphatase family protein [Polyangiaceae bacterium]
MKRGPVGGSRFAHRRVLRISRDAGSFAFVPLSLATFNLKDFFPQPGLDFAAKVAWTAAMIARLDADVLGLQEVGPPESVDALLASTPDYRSVVVGTPDARGIRCAVLSRLPIVRSYVHTAESLPFTVFQDGDPPPFGGRIPLRRGVVYGRVDAGAFGSVDVLVVHFKSRRAVPMKSASGAPLSPTTQRELGEGELRSMVWRASEALYVRGLVDEVFTAEPSARLAVIGDLNDVAGSTPVELVRGNDCSTGALSSCADRVALDQRFSIRHDGGRMQIDHILASAPLFARLSAARFFNDELREHAPLPSVEVVASSSSA